MKTLYVLVAHMNCTSLLKVSLIQLPREIAETSGGSDLYPRAVESLNAFSGSRTAHVYMLALDSFSCGHLKLENSNKRQCSLTIITVITITTIL